MNRAVVVADTEGRIVSWDASAVGSSLDRAAANLPVLHADGTQRLLPARFIFRTDGRGTPAGAAAVDAEAVGGEQPRGEVLPFAEAEAS